MNSPNQPFHRVVIVSLLLLILVASASAQPRGRRPPRNRRAPPGMRGIEEDVALILMSMGIVQEELRITRKQGELLEALAMDFAAQRQGSRSSSRQQQIKTNEKLFNVLLDKHQSQRFAQLKWRFLGAYAIDDAQFAKDVLLTADQMKQIRMLRGKEHVELPALTDTLGEVQLAKWKRKLGKDFAVDETWDEYSVHYQEMQRKPR